ncbi:DMT family transporter [Candidatus Clostridium stratigraminis]|uniref:DMT family transporter n=1 Tax=Candidatus Clostridium stratigraminis TaxID=3381661 RepID=A0ABW8T5Y4_9CLOT
MYKLLSGFIGILITVMLVVNGALSKNTGTYSSIVIIHIIGLICISCILLIKRIKLKLHNNIPVYLYSAGAIGVFTVLLNNLSFNNIGASLTLALGLLGQSITSIVIDHYGLLGAEVYKFKKQKLIGLIIITLGIVIMTFY